jgi:hypothetical protein
MCNLFCDGGDALRRAQKYGTKLQGNELGPHKRIMYDSRARSHFFFNLTDTVQGIRNKLHTYKCRVQEKNDPSKEKNNDPKKKKNVEIL